MPLWLLPVVKSMPLRLVTQRLLRTVMNPMSLMTQLRGLSSMPPAIQIPAVTSTPVAGAVTSMPLWLATQMSVMMSVPPATQIPVVTSMPPWLVTQMLMRPVTIPMSPMTQLPGLTSMPPAIQIPIVTSTCCGRCCDVR